MGSIFNKITVRGLVAGAMFIAAGAPAQSLPRQVLSGHVPAVVAQLNPVGRVATTNRLQLAIGLPLRNQPALDDLLAQLYDPGSTNYHKFLTPGEFTARFGPTEQDYAAVQAFARANGFAVRATHGNRVVLDVEASAADIERAFQVTLKTFQHPTEGRHFFAPDTEPSVPTNLPVADMWGLSDYARPTPLAHQADAANISPQNYNGSGSSGSYQGADFRNAYAPGTSLTGSGQIAAVAEFDGYYQSDINNYLGLCGYTNVPLTNVLLDGVTGLPGYSGLNNAVLEVSLDIELMIAMAPGLAKVIVYEGSNPYDVFNRIVTDNTAKQISCSWLWSAGRNNNWSNNIPGTTLDSQLKQMATQGQSFFQASGDANAYTGSQSLNSFKGPIPVDSIYVTSVGGTSLTMNSPGASWASETVWNWGGNQGSGGGISPNYSIPSWQANVSMTANSGSTTKRNIPDVALTADAVFVKYSNGQNAPNVGGTSCAAPLWAGFCALANQQAAAGGGTNVGFLNPALYAIAASTNYNNCFHDVTTGNNVGNFTAGLFNAVTNYDLATGLGTPNGTNLINFLAPLPCFLTPPASQNVTNGASVVFSAVPGGRPPFGFRWLFNGTNLPAGGTISGTGSAALSIAPAATNNSGNYQIVATNNFGSVTSSVAVLSVGFAPVFSAQPTNLTILSGSNAVFSATVGGSAPLVYQWRKNGTNVVNGAGISGATSNVLALAAVTNNNSGNYTLAVTNNFGVSTSSVAALTVVLPPTITTPPANQSIECGSNVVFSAAAAGTPPLNFQWSLDGTPLSGATNTTLLLTNIHLPNHAIALVVTNLYGGATSSVVLTVHDTLAPVITMNGNNPIYVELGGAFTDPGATANDLCAGAVPVTASGSVNTSVLGTNTLTYTTSDGNGNTNTATRTVIVRDTTPPTILWSFTNLVLAANANCAAFMPDVTGTNFILAADFSGALTISQSPTNNATLLLGSNVVVITVKDASGNTAYSTNAILVQDQTPPVITLLGANPLTNESHSAFADPGVTASDNCSGVVAFATNSTVNPNALGTYLISYIATDAAGNSATNTRTVVVVDTTPPMISLLGANPLTNECHSAFVDPGAMATDVGSGVAAFATNGIVDPNSPGIYFISYVATDAVGNSATNVRTVIVVDTTPPVITQCAPAQTLTAGTNCTAILPDYTGTLSATDVCSGIVHIAQLPPPGSVLALGTNLVTLLVDDGNGNTNSCTATVTVLEALPQIWSQTPSQTNHAGTGASFSIAVNACSPVNYQWYFNGSPAAGQTNSTLALPLVHSCDAGNYQVVATSGSGSVTSSLAVLAVINDPTNISPAGAWQVGTQTECSGIVFNPGSSYTWEISDANTIWDWLNIAGTLDVVATSTNPFTIKIISLTVSNTPGLTANFAGMSNYAWIIATASGGITNFDPGSFAVDASAFSNAFGGNFSVIQQDTNFVLQYVAPPAPLVLTSGTTLGNGTFQLSFNGPVSQTYRILATTNLFAPLSNWMVLTTGSFSGGIIRFTDPSASNQPVQFYRAASP